MADATFPTFDGHKMTYKCLHPGCHYRLIDADASHKHAITFHASWLQTLPLHAHYCQEVLGSPATWESGYVTIGPDGAIGDGSAMRPLDHTQTFHVIVYDEATAPAKAAPPAPAAAECLDPLEESWRPSGQYAESGTPPRPHALRSGLPSATQGEPQPWRAATARVRDRPSPRLSVGTFVNLRRVEQPRAAAGGLQGQRPAPGGRNRRCSP